MSVELRRPHAAAFGVASALLVAASLLATSSAHHHGAASPVRAAAVVAPAVTAVLPAPPAPAPAPIVVPPVPPMPPHNAATDAPQLTAHVALLTKQIDEAAVAAQRAAAAAVSAQTHVEQTRTKLDQVATVAAAVGAPIPVVPPMPSPPPAVTTTGQVVDLPPATVADVAAAAGVPVSPEPTPVAPSPPLASSLPSLRHALIHGDDGTSAALPLTADPAPSPSASPSPTPAPANAPVAEPVTPAASPATATDGATAAAQADDGLPSSQVTPLDLPDDALAAATSSPQKDALTKGRLVQLEVSAAQVDLVTAVATAQVQQLHVAQLQAQLASTQQALKSLPPPDPRSSAGCPTVAPDDTLRGGSASVGLAKLCADSVAAAATPQAALAIKWALSNLGLPYSQPLRNDPGWADCSSFVARAYTVAGVGVTTPGVNAPTTDDIRMAAWAVLEPAAQLRPGDLVEPEPGHVAMVLADGFMVHTNATGDVAHVSAAYAHPWASFRIAPAEVGQPAHADPMKTGAIPDLSWMETPAAGDVAVPPTAVAVAKPTPRPSATPKPTPKPSTAASPRPVTSPAPGTSSPPPPALPSASPAATASATGAGAGQDG